MAKNQPSTGSQEHFSWKGKQVTLTVSGDSGTIVVDGKTFEATRSATGMWSSPGVFNHYRDLGDLARHTIYYLYLFTPSR